MYLFYILAYNIENYYNILLIAAYIMSILSTILVISTIEKYIVTKTRFMITILAAVIILIGVIFLFIAEQSPKLRIINQVAAPVLGVFVLGLYLMVIVKSTGDLRKRALFTLFGILVLLLGMFLDTESMMAILGSGPQLLLAPLSVIIGSIIIIQSQKQL
jgi:Na+-transporting NADH:ubiquinone oxidoreductase subunit NqrB